MSEGETNIPTCWVVSDGRAGIENQALGLAEALARKTPLDITIKRIEIGGLWRKLPQALWGEPFSRLTGASDPLSPPYPDLWIASGRRSVPFTVAVKKRRPAIFTVQTQNPRADASLFDLVIPPAHDGLGGDTVFPILGAPHRVTREGARAAAQASTLDFSSLGSPRLAVLIGGPNRAFDISGAQSARLLERLARLAADGAGLMVTTSRRTPPAFTAGLKSALSATPHFFFDAGAASPTEDNPYFAFLGAADAVLATEDSVNMATEVAALGKPLYILPLDRKSAARSAKFQRFHDELVRRGHARRFDDALSIRELASWSPPPLDDTDRAADHILACWRRDAGA